MPRKKSSRRSSRSRRVRRSQSVRRRSPKRYRSTNTIQFLKDTQNTALAIKLEELKTEYVEWKETRRTKKERAEIEARERHMQELQRKREKQQEQDAQQKEEEEKEYNIYYNKHKDNTIDNLNAIYNNLEYEAQNNSTSQWSTSSNSDMEQRAVKELIHEKTLEATNVS